MSSLETCFCEYFKFFIETIEFWRSMVDRSPVMLRPLCNQTEQLRLCHRAQLDEEFLLKFPDVKDKLLGKIVLCIEEEMKSIVKAQQELKLYVDGLKSRFNAIEKAYEKRGPEEDREFNPLIPSYDKLLECAIDMWKCFHVLWLGVKTSIDNVDYYNEDTIKSIADAFCKFKKVEENIKYITDLTHYLRSPSNL